MSVPTVKPPARSQVLADEATTSADVASTSGLPLMALAVTCFSGMAACVSELGGAIPAHEVIFLRTLVTVPVLLAMLRARGISPWGNDRRLLMARGLVGFCSMQA